MGAAIPLGVLTEKAPPVVGSSDHGVMGIA